LHYNESKNNQRAKVDKENSLKKLREEFAQEKVQSEVLNIKELSHYKIRLIKTGK